MEFSLEGGEGDGRVEIVTTFRYLIRPLYQTYDDWTAVWRDIMHTSLFWGGLVTLIQKEWAYPRVAEIFTGHWYEQY